MWSFSSMAVVVKGGKSTLFNSRLAWLHRQIWEPGWAGTFPYMDVEFFSWVWIASVEGYYLPSFFSYLIWKFRSSSAEMKSSVLIQLKKLLEGWKKARGNDWEGGMVGPWVIARSFKRKPCGKKGKNNEEEKHLLSRIPNDIYQRSATRVFPHFLLSFLVNWFEGWNLWLEHKRLLVKTGSGHTPER